MDRSNYKLDYIAYVKRLIIEKVIINNTIVQTVTHVTTFILLTNGLKPRRKANCIDKKILARSSV
jgi:hypothetical protein